MMIETNPDNVAFSAYGEFLPFTDEDWAEYDAYAAEEFAAWEAERALDDEEYFFDCE